MLSHAPRRVVGLGAIAVAERDARPVVLITCTWSPLGKRHRLGVISCPLGHAAECVLTLRDALTQHTCLGVPRDGPRPRGAAPAP